MAKYGYRLLKISGSITQTDTLSVFNIKIMESIMELTFFLTLAHELKSAELAVMLNTGMAYKDLTLLLLMALFAMAGADQFSMIKGKFSKSKNAGAVANPAIEKKPFRQLFKHQLFTGFVEEQSYLRGAEQIGGVKFFIYNLLALGAWLSLLVALGAVLRTTWVGYLGSFGPFEVEFIAAVMAAYVLILAFVLFKK